jgi:hypothetical protein
MTDATSIRRSVELAAPWVVGLLLAVPVLVAFYPPMTDLPYHEAAVGILRHFGDSSRFPPGLYERNLGEPNQLFHMVAWALSYVVSTRWAVKLLVAATVVAVPVCGGHFARHVGATPLASLVVAPMAVGWLFAWGLVTNLVGLAVFLAVAPQLDRFAAQPTRRGMFATAGALLLLYSAHEAMLLVYAGAALALATLHPWSVQKTTMRLVPFTLGVAIAVGQARWQVRFMTPAVRGMPRIWEPIRHKLERIPYIILPASETPVLASMFGLCLLVIGSFFWLRARQRGAGPRLIRLEAHALPPARAWAMAYRWELFVVACFAAYLAFPLTLNGATLVYQRWFPPAFAVLAIVAAPRDLWTRAARVTRIAVMTLPIATLLVAWPSFADSNREYQALEPILAQIKPGSAVADVDLGPGDPSRTYSLGPAAGRILATLGGRLAFAFTDSSVSPVVIPRRYQWGEPLIRIGFDSWGLRPAHDLHLFRYVLMRTTDPRLAWMGVLALAPEARLIAQSGEWMLFESRFPTVPLLSHNFWLMGPPPENLRDRIRAVIAASKDAAAPTVSDEPAKGPGL